jgi:hypothetical protein
MYNGSIIMLDPAKSTKEKKILILIVMDEMESHINRLPTHGRARSSRI